MLEINFHHLRVFAAVARQLSYSRAAEQLYISQPAVSRHVQELERVVGAQVFDRKGRGVSLTDAGRRVFEYAQRVMDLTDELDLAVRELEDISKGHLRLVASSTLGIYVLPAFLGVFRRRFPEVEVSLRVSNSQSAASAMLEGGFHLAFVSMEIDAPGLQRQTLGTDELVVAAAPDHPFTRRLIMPQELCDETILLREVGSGTRRCFEVEMERLGVKPRRVLEMGSTEAIRRGIASGLGLSAIPRRSLPEGEAVGSLGLVGVEGMDLRRPLGMLTRKGTRLPPAALAFGAALQKTGV